jgi:hypothetical protein
MFRVSVCFIGHSSVARNFDSSYRILPRSFVWNTPSVVFWAVQFSSFPFVFLSGLDLLVSSDMLLQPPDRKLPLDCPTHCHQADRRDSRTSHKVNVRVPLRAASRFVEEVGPSQEECWGKENAEAAVFSHQCLAESPLGLF